MPAKDSSPKDRVDKAIAFQKADRTPRDFAAVPEVWEKLIERFGTKDRKEVLKRLGVDCRIVSYDSFCRPPGIDPEGVDLNASQERSSVGGMWRKVEPDGSNRDIWGAHRKKVPARSGALDQFASFPLESAQSVDDLKKYPWPQPDWWNFDDLRSFIEELNDTAIYNIRYRLGSVFETAWSLYNFEKFLLDLALNPEMPLYVMECIAEVHLENLRAVLEAAGDLIDIVYFYDDVASQDGLLIGPEMYGKLIQPFHQKIIDTAASAGKPVMMHSCGSVYPMIDRFIDMGVRILNPVQPGARDMDLERLADQFGGRIAFHGGIDIQTFLPYASPGQVREKVDYTAELLGACGGYIMAGSHHIQADTPVENILAMYQVSGGE
ncbi:MAG TPA: uroporphyrinogen decarboxylase family protein [archaeon]|nr:uroporphyrinogen decarboxylase family protein [archaeon]